VTQVPGNVSDVATVVRDAHDRGTPLRIVGRGRWLEGGASVSRGATSLELSALCGIVDYVPDDLTVTVRAGTTLAELDAVTAPHRQWCPLLPWGGDDGSVGATFATATTGPFTERLGAPRDLALGLEFVDGAGTVIRAGGRVVKNVAGFDLTRLLVGSWGTLGVITEISVRLRARPVVDESWRLRLDRDAASSRAALAAYRRGALAPLAMETLRPDEAHALGFSASADDPGTVHTIVRIGGNASFVAASRAALGAVAPAEPFDPHLWTRYRAVADRPRRLDPESTGGVLAQRVRQQFDPRHILNPGIFAEPLRESA
jgi:glycolate oxidase FAD binding subunit